MASNRQIENLKGHLEDDHCATVDPGWLTEEHFGDLLALHNGLHISHSRKAEAGAMHVHDEADFSE